MMILGIGNHQTVLNVCNQDPVALMAKGNAVITPSLLVYSSMKMRSIEIQQRAITAAMSKHFNNNT